MNNIGKNFCRSCIFQEIRTDDKGFRNKFCTLFNDFLKNKNPERIKECLTELNMRTAKLKGVR